MNIHEKAGKRPGGNMTNALGRRILNSSPIYFFSYDEMWKTYIKWMGAVDQYESRSMAWVHSGIIIKNSPLGFSQMFLGQSFSHGESVCDFS